MFGECAAIRPLLGAYVDGELVGAERLRVCDHLDDCAPCRDEVECVRELGAALRFAALPDDTPEMAGLAGGVISRVRAERAQSWRGLVSRAVDSWHWAIVGLGSMAGATASTLIIASVLWFGPAPERGDSLAAMLSDLTVQETTFFVRPASQNWDQMAWSVAQGAAATGGASATPVMFIFPGASEQDLVRELAQALAPRGRQIRLDYLSPNDQQYALDLLDNLNRIRTVTNRVVFLSSTTVTAKGL